MCEWAWLLCLRYGGVCFYPMRKFSLFSIFFIALISPVLTWAQVCDAALPPPAVTAATPPAVLTAAAPGAGSCGGGTPCAVYGGTVPEGDVTGLVAGCVGTTQYTATAGTCSGGVLSGLMYGGSSLVVYPAGPSFCASDYALTASACGSTACLSGGGP